MLPVTVIVPVRNAESMVDACLASIFLANPREVIVVDGNSTDHTLELINKYPVKILSDNGRGVPAARMLGIQEASSDVVVLIDVDIVLPEGVLENLYAEYIDGEYDGFQAGLESISGDGYWGRALATHHNRGRSKNWPGVMATIFRRDILLKFRFDEGFRSGEDIELRWRLQKAGLKMGVSQKNIVKHQFDDTYEAALDQFVQDGRGLGRMYAKYGIRAIKLLFIPAAGCARGILLSLLRFEVQWIPYYLVYAFYNYISMPAGLQEKM